MQRSIALHNLRGKGTFVSAGIELKVVSPALLNKSLHWVILVSPIDKAFHRKHDIRRLWPLTHFIPHLAASL